MAAKAQRTKSARRSMGVQSGPAGGYTQKPKMDTPAKPKKQKRQRKQSRGK